MEFVILILGLLFVVGYGSWNDVSDGGVLILCMAWAIVWGFWQPLAATPEEKAAQQAQEQAKRYARETPKVIREADGCQIYAFERSGREHYFTRCPATTSTETNWTENCGKNCTSHKQESIVTNNKR